MRRDFFKKISLITLGLVLGAQSLCANPAEWPKEVNFGVIPVAERLLWNFGIASIILIPNTVNREKNPKIRFCLKAGIIFMYLIYFYYTIGVKNNNNVLPYKTIFMR